MTGTWGLRQAVLAGFAVSLFAVGWPGMAAARDVTVVISNMKFGDIPSDLKVGDTIIWVNKDMFRHSATARDKSFDLDLPPGTEQRSTVSKAEHYEVYCRYHPNMIAAFTVAQ